MKNCFIHAGMAAALFVATSGAGLAGLPTYYPEDIPYTGIVGGISNNIIIVDANTYHLDSSVRVHTLSTAYGSTHSLTVNTPIGFTKTSDRSGNSVITEIWVMPEVEQD
jgi:hypothetical protein